MTESITYLSAESNSFLALGKANFQNTGMEDWQIRKKGRIFAGLTQEEVGKHFDPPISRVAVSNWEKSVADGGNAPDQKKLKILGELYKMTVGQLLGHERVNFAEVRSEISHAYAVNTDRFIEVQSLDNPVGAGGQPLKDYDVVDGDFAFRRSFFTKRGLTPGDCRIATAVGRSMAPYINHGDKILVNTADKRIVDGEVYVIRTTEELKIKRLYKQLDGRVRVESDNKEFRDEFITPDAPADIVGRFVIRSG
jgi:SOS-response transcriptional repressor LexA